MHLREGGHVKFVKNSLLRVSIETVASKLAEFITNLTLKGAETGGGGWGLGAGALCWENRFKAADEPLLSPIQSVYALVQIQNNNRINFKMTYPTRSDCHPSLADTDSAAGRDGLNPQGPWCRCRRHHSPVSTVSHPWPGDSPWYVRHH